MMEETIRILHQGDPNDTRFQFEVVKQLAESVKVTSEILRGMGDTQTRMLERLARIEEQRTHEAVAAITARVNALESERDQRQGAAGVSDRFLKWWGPMTWTLGIVFTVLFLILRATGILHLPDSGPAVITREAREVDRRTEGSGP